MEVELKPAGVSSCSSRKGFGSYIREDLLILADFLAALPPLAPDRCLCGAGVSPFPPFLFGLYLRYLVVDLTPSTRADSSRTQIYPLFVSSVGVNFSTFLKACSAFSNQFKKEQGFVSIPRSWTNCAGCCSAILWMMDPWLCPCSSQTIHRFL